MSNNPYYIDENGILIMGVFYTGQTFVDDNKYNYYNELSPNNYVSSVKPDGSIDVIIL